MDLDPAEVALVITALRQWAQQLNRAYGAMGVESGWATDARVLATRLEREYTEPDEDEGRTM